MARKQYCVVCARPKAGHPLPFGKSCKMPPLPDAEKQKYLAEQQKQALEDSLPTDEEDDLDSGDEGVTVEDLEKQEQALLAMKQKMLESKEKAKQRLEATKKAKTIYDRIQKLKEEMLTLNGDLQTEWQNIDGMQKEMAGPSPLDLPPIGRQEQGTSRQTDAPGQQQQPAPTAVGPNQQVPGQQAPCQGNIVVHQPTGTVHLAPVQQQPEVHNFNGARPKQTVQAVPPPVAAANQVYQAALDPALAAYAQAYSAPPRVQPGVHAATRAAAAAPVVAPVAQQPTVPGQMYPPQAPQPGVPPQVWMQQQPLIGAAAGLAGVAAAAPPPGDRREGKCLPENFIEKSALNDTEVKAPSYYDFVHGIFRMLKDMHNDRNESISDLLVYYEQLSSYATHHRWSAVFSLHRSMCNEVSIGMRSWDSEIKHRDVSKHLNTASDLSELKQKQAQSQNYSQGQGSADVVSSVSSGGGKKGKNKNRPRLQSDMSFASYVHQGQGQDKSDRPICRLYNHHARGCTFGANTCDFRHECATCEEKGIRGVAHPAMYCAIINAKPSDQKK